MNDDIDGKRIAQLQKEKIQSDKLVQELLDDRLLAANAQGEGKRDFKLVSSVGYEKQLIKLFEEVFKEPMSQAFWDWKYEGVHWRAVCALKDGKIISHYNGMARDIRFFGQPKRAIQPCDTMVSAKARGGIRTNSPFFSSTKTWIDTNLGLDKEFLLTYGFPNERVMLLAKKMGLYEEVDTIREIIWNTNSPIPDATLDIVPYDYNSDMNAQIDQLWETMADDFKDGIIGVRNAAFLRRRYQRHPVITYSPYLVYGENRKLLAVFVLRVEGGLCGLMDIIAPKERFSMVLCEALRTAKNKGAGMMMARIPSARTSLFEHCNAQVKETDIVIPTISIVEGLDPETIKGKWFIMYGDTDFA